MSSRSRSWTTRERPAKQARIKFSHNDQDTEDTGSASDDTDSCADFTNEDWGPHAEALLSPLLHMQTLQEMFPDKSFAELFAVLRGANNDVASAADVLMKAALEAEATPASADDAACSQLMQICCELSRPRALQLLQRTGNNMQQAIELALNDETAEAPPPPPSPLNRNVPDASALPIATTAMATLVQDLEPQLQDIKYILPDIDVAHARAVLLHHNGDLQKALDSLLNNGSELHRSPPSPEPDLETQDDVDPLAAVLDVLPALVHERDRVCQALKDANGDVTLAVAMLLSPGDAPADTFDVEDGGASAGELDELLSFLEAERVQADADNVELIRRMLIAEGEDPEDHGISYNDEGMTSTKYIPDRETFLEPLRKLCDVVSVKNIIRPQLAAAFDKRWELFNERYHTTLPPTIAFHGTATRNVQSIHTNGLRVPDGQHLAVANGANYGKGIYLSPSAQKSLCYCRGESNGIVSMIVCACLPGRCYRCDRPIGAVPLRQGYDSHADPLGLELVLFDSSQVLPCYVVSCRMRSARVHSAVTSSWAASASSTPRPKRTPCPHAAWPRSEIPADSCQCLSLRHNTPRGARAIWRTTSALLP